MGTTKAVHATGFSVPRAAPDEIWMGFNSGWDALCMARIDRASAQVPRPRRRFTSRSYTGRLNNIDEVGSLSVPLFSATLI